jgi:holin-like protein
MIQKGRKNGKKGFHITSKGSKKKEAFSKFTAAMRILLQIAVIFAICLVGEFLHNTVGVPLPGNIIGMILLFLLLCLKIIKPAQIKDVSDFFLKRIAFFFLPASIGIMAAGDEILKRWPLLLILCIVLTIVTMVATGWTVQILSRKKGDDKP